MGRKKENRIYSMFKYNDETKQSQCLENGCKQYIKGNHGGNLLRHFYTQHREKHDEIVRLNTERRENMPLPERTTDVAAAVLDYCTNLITVHGRPFDIVEDEAFRQILKLIPGITPRELQAINVKNIKENIRKKYECKQHEVLLQLSKFNGIESSEPVHIKEDPLDWEDI